jgi:quercetin dioxygenase-like cupin family protein
MERHPKRPTSKAPADWFTGDAWIDLLAAVDEYSRLNIGSIHFAPGARTAWHSHSGGQTLYVTEGRGQVQARGEKVVELKPGDVVHAPNGEEHWHGAAPGHFMTHLSVSLGTAEWGPHVTDEEYGPHSS